jgi:hypothetical protein
MSGRNFILSKCILLYLLFPATINAQQNIQMRDSLTRQLRRDSARIFRPTIAKPYLKAENRNSFLAAEHVNLLGFLAGATLHERHVIAAGYYFLYNRSKLITLTDDKAGKQQLSSLSYVNFAYQYVLFNHRYVQLNVPVEVGYGVYRGHTDSLGKISLIGGNILPLAVGLQFFLKPIRWLGASATGGYRQVKRDVIGVPLDGWYYSFGLWIDARQVFRALRYRSYRNRYHREIIKY